MLRINTVHPQTYLLLRSLMELPDLESFALAGGTGLALHLGHRISVDLDLFTCDEFESGEVLDVLRQHYLASDALQSRNALSLFVGGDGSERVKLDFIRHNYPLIGPIQRYGSIRMFSVEDIAAMKLNAVANRGAKKDFFDVFALLQRFDIDQLISFFEQKYPHSNSYAVMKSLVYFEDADLEPDPVSLSKVQWRDVKEKMKDVISGG